MAGLSFWKSSTLQRFLELERENEGLKQRLQGLLQQAEPAGTHSVHASIPRPIPGLVQRR